MVDFNSGNTVGVPAADIEKVSVLERRQHLIDAWEFYYRKEKMSGKAHVKSRLFAFFLQIRAMLERRYKKDEFQALKKLIESSKIDDLMLASEKLFGELDDLHITRLDMRDVYDTTRVEVENKMKGLG